jgi:methylated-DNA-[protein]-cysteine S-methyltransferase
MEMRNWLEALDGYFAGRPPRVSVEQMETSGCTEFQQRVYRELALVPWGKVVTYGCLAERVGVPGGARAVGQAMGRNPLPIFVPCHRVVAAGRHLGGFGAGLRWKRELLSHEGWTFREDRLR